MRKETNATPFVVAQGLGKSFRDGPGVRRVLERVDLTLHRKEMVAVLGPSGCGKTTLLNMVAGLVRPDQGRVSIGGTDLDFRHPSQVAGVRLRHIGLLSQHYGLHPDETVLANVELPLLFVSPVMDRRKRQAAAVSALERAGLDPMLGQRVSRLSAGEQQRVALARAIVGDTDFLVVDEPTANVDEVTGLRVVGTLREIAATGAAVIVATHDSAVSVACDARWRIASRTLVEAP